MPDLLSSRSSLLDGLRIVLGHTIGRLTPKERERLLRLVTDLVKAGASGAAEGARKR